MRPSQMCIEYIPRCLEESFSQESLPMRRRAVTWHPGTREPRSFRICPACGKIIRRKRYEAIKCPECGKCFHHNDVCFPVGLMMCGACAAK